MNRLAHEVALLRVTRVVGPRPHAAQDLFVRRLGRGAPLPVVGPADHGDRLLSEGRARPGCQRVPRERTPPDFFGNLAEGGEPFVGPLGGAEPGDDGPLRGIDRRIVAVLGIAGVPPREVQEDLGAGPLAAAPRLGDLAGGRPAGLDRGEPSLPGQTRHLAVRGEHDLKPRPKHVRASGQELVLGQENGEKRVVVKQGLEPLEGEPESRVDNKFGSGVSRGLGRGGDPPAVAADGPVSLVPRDGLLRQPREGGKVVVPGPAKEVVAAASHLLVGCPRALLSQKVPVEGRSGAQMVRGGRIGRHRRGVRALKSGARRRPVGGPLRAPPGLFAAAPKRQAELSLGRSLAAPRGVGRPTRPRFRREVDQTDDNDNDRDQNRDRLLFHLPR